MMKRFLAPALLLLTSCTSAAYLPAVAAPSWDTVPAGVVEALCRRLHDDAIATGVLGIVKTTQPLTSSQSLGALGHAAQKRGDATRAAEAMKSGTRVIPISFGDESSCEWVQVAPAEARKQSDQMTVEISAPIPNPFAPQEAGMFARVSLGGQMPAWYWIPLGSRNGAWAVGHIMPLVM